MRRWLRVTLVAAVAAVPMSAPFAAGTAQAQEAWQYDRTMRIVNAGHPDETYDATVKVSQTSNLFNRQGVEIELDNFKLTHNANNLAVAGRSLEYPVVVMQCRTDDPTPEMCFSAQRSVYYAGYDAGVLDPAWRERATRIRTQGSTAGFPGETPRERKVNWLRTEQVPFAAADDISYLWDLEQPGDGVPWIDEPKVKSYPPPDALDGLPTTITTRTVRITKDPDTGVNTSGKIDFEVRQRVSQASLGCTETQKCSIVVVPIMDMACAENAPNTPNVNDCDGGAWGSDPDDTGGGTDTVNKWVTQQAWLANSNWRNKFVVPITFAPDPGSCGVQDQRPRVPVHGSELADVAQERWGSAYCAGARPANYLPEYSSGPEYEARRQFTSELGGSYGQDAILTTQPVVDSPRPVVHAPSALTGFAIAFTIDDARGQAVEELTLSPRLLAKLLTQSYTPSTVGDVRDSKTRYTGSAEQLAAINTAGNGNAYYWEHPSIFRNPRNIFADQEFLALNPDLRTRKENGSLASQFFATQTPVVFQAESDIIVDLTRYIVADPAARKWLDGEPDEQGMVVNPAWKGMRAFELYTLADEVVRPAPPRRPNWAELAPAHYFVTGTGDHCDEQIGSPLMTRYANITSSAENAALTLRDRRGSATPLCTWVDEPVPPAQQPNPVPPGESAATQRVYSEAKLPTADFGFRAMLSVTTVAHAELYQLPTAKLVNAGGKAVAPTPGTMVNALTAAVQDDMTGTVELDYDRITGDAAYPGTMIAFTAAPTSGLALDVAARYADFIEFMATDGQTPGDSITSLPPGYDPLTANLRQQALDAARAVREQKGEVPPIPEGGPLGGDATQGTSSSWSGDTTAGPPGAPVNPQAAASDADEKDDPRTVAQTKGSGSWLSRWALPLLFALGAVAALAAFVVGAATQPDHPARRLLRTVLRR